MDNAGDSKALMQELLLLLPSSDVLTLSEVSKGVNLSVRQVYKGNYYWRQRLQQKYDNYLLPSYEQLNPRILVEALEFNKDEYPFSELYPLTSELLVAVISLLGYYPDYQLVKLVEYIALLRGAGITDEDDEGKIHVDITELQYHSRIVDKMIQLGLIDLVHKSIEEQAIANNDVGLMDLALKLGTTVYWFIDTEGNIIRNAALYIHLLNNHELSDEYIQLIITKASAAENMGLFKSVNLDWDRLIPVIKRGMIITGKRESLYDEIGLTDNKELITAYIKYEKFNAKQVAQLIASIPTSKIANEVYTNYVATTGTLPDSNMLLARAVTDVLELALSDPDADPYIFLTRENVPLGLYQLAVKNERIESGKKLTDLLKNKLKLGKLKQAKILVESGKVNPFQDNILLDQVGRMHYVGVEVLLDSPLGIDDNVLKDALLAAASNPGMFKLLLRDPRTDPNMNDGELLVELIEAKKIKALGLWLGHPESNVDVNQGIGIKTAVQLGKEGIPIIELLLNHGAKKKVAALKLAKHIGNKKAITLLL